MLHLDGTAAAELAGRLQSPTSQVKSVERKPFKRSPYAPFRTTTLQQEASRKLGFTAKHAMSVAQRLYENGYITYMRTDSTTLSQTAIDAARHQARELYGDSYVPDKPRVYASKVKNAQEAHEAIRPAGDRFRTPEQVARDGLSRDEQRLYDLVWKRTVASQMTDATGESVSVRVAGTSSAGEQAEFGASGNVIKFYGFLKAYVEGADDPNTDRDDRERRLPPLSENDPLEALRLAAAEHATRPPARFTEASLVKELEDREIGRPSTYASIIGTILDRGYVFKKGTALVPSYLAFAVITLMEKHFGQLVDYDFTARMEGVLDDIAHGEAARVPWLRRFYFGGPDQQRRRDRRRSRRRRRDRPEGSGQRHRRHRPAAGQLVPAGRHRHHRPGRPVRALPGARRPAGQRARGHGAGRADPGQGRGAVQPSRTRTGTLGTDPGTGLTVVAKSGRFGPYVTEVLAEDAPASAKPRTGSLLKSMSLDTVSLDDALKLLSLPRTIGELDDEPVTVQNGRYGPYVKKGTDSRSLENEDQLFTLTLAEAKDLFSQPKPRAPRAARPHRRCGRSATTRPPVSRWW